MEHFTCFFFFFRFMYSSYVLILCFCSYTLHFIRIWKTLPKTFIICFGLLTGLKVGENMAYISPQKIIEKRGPKQKENNVKNKELNMKLKMKRIGEENFFHIDALRCVVRTIAPTSIFCFHPFFFGLLHCLIQLMKSKKF